MVCPQAYDMPFNESMITHFIENIFVPDRSPVSILNRNQPSIGYTLKSLLLQILLLQKMPNGVPEIYFIIVCLNLKCDSSSFRHKNQILNPF